MRQAEARFAEVSRDMTRADLIQKLGAPQEEDATSATWTVRYNVLNYDSMKAVFTRDGHILSITKTRCRGWGSDNYHIDLSTHTSK